MSRRNIILLIVVLSFITIVGMLILYFQNPETENPAGNNDTNFFSKIFGTGGNKDDKKDGGDAVDISGEGQDSGTTEAPKPVLKKISSFPIAGFGIFMKERFKDVPKEEKITEIEIEKSLESSTPLKPTPPPTETVPYVRYVNRQNGNIYQSFADRNEEYRFSSTLIPKVEEAYFGNNGERVIMRYLKSDNRTIETFLGVVPKEYLGADGGINEINGSFLPENISDISISPDSEEMFYLFPVKDTAVGTTLSFEKESKTQEIDSPFTEWLSSWSGKNKILLTTKPSGKVGGFSYLLDRGSKNLNKVLDNKTGLTALASPDGKKIIYSGGQPLIIIKDVESGEETITNIQTLPEKCVFERVYAIYCLVPKFISSSVYPDAWYTGEISFDDQIWKINLIDGVGKMIVDPVLVEGGEEIDGIKPAIDENGEYLFFVNKKDSYLWRLKLN